MISERELAALREMIDELRGLKDLIRKSMGYYSRLPGGKPWIPEPDYEPVRLPVPETNLRDQLWSTLPLRGKLVLEICRILLYFALGGGLLDFIVGYRLPDMVDHAVSAAVVEELHGHGRRSYEGSGE